MIILTTLPTDATDAPLTPLNAVWSGVVEATAPLPRLGHLALVCPLDEAAIACASTVVDGRHYILLLPAAERPFTLVNVSPGPARLVVLLLSPGFITHLAEFLDIPTDLSTLLHGVPLLQGDAVSELLHLLAQTGISRAEAEDIAFEVVGQMLQQLRLRHDALRRLAHHKDNTLDDLLPRLLAARQFIEAGYLEPLKTADVAAHVALSAYHFARLFKAAFEVTVYQYVLQLRLDRARHLLAALPVTEVALAVGYSSLSAFIHAFRRRYGITPSAYQELAGIRKSSRR